MAKITVLGAGVAGLSTAMLLARDGHEVTVLERDAAPPPSNPDEAWRDWDRKGVNQFRLLHYFAPRFREIMDANLPDVTAEMEAAGALRINPLRGIPDEISGGVREGDDRFTAVTARRPIGEAAIARVVAKTDNVEVRRGVAVKGLLTGEPSANGIPHVVGVITESGEELRADVVVDAGGRRSVLPSWLDAIGATAPVEELEDCGFVYYGRHFRSPDGSTPAIFGPLLS